MGTKHRDMGTEHRDMAIGTRRPTPDRARPGELWSLSRRLYIRGTGIAIH